MEKLRLRVQKSRTAWDRQTSVLVGNWQRAGSEFVNAAGEASTSFGRFVSRESKDWGAFVQEAARETPSLLDSAKAQELERELLLQLVRLLDSFQGTVQARLRQLSAPAVDSDGVLPLPGYDQLTAREIVARVAELSVAQCEAVREFEDRHKKRATILRALDQRLSN